MDAKQSVSSMFGKLEHVGVVVKDIDKTVKFLNSLGFGSSGDSESMFEIPFKGEVRGKPMEWRVGIYNIMMGDIELELLQPLEGRDLLREYLDDVGEGIHHIGFATDDIEKATEMMAGMGIKKIMGAPGPGGGGFGYFETNLFGGIIVELRQLVD
jgi:methylmalonyl-CoA/ethylmalonyl-CoA epimerase